jgi:CBS domain-containing membrane protein
MNVFTPVRHIMSRAVDTVQVDSPVSAARTLLRSRPFHHVPVLRGNQLVGILSAADIARVSLEAFVADGETVDAWLDETTNIPALMTHEPETIRPDATLREAAARLSEGAFHALPVVGDGGELEGILTTTDVVRFVGMA